MERNHKMRERIIQIRRLIRTHRDQIGDDRCWVDDGLVWSALPDSPPEMTTIPSDAMERCEAFFRLRRADEADVVPYRAMRDPERWDEDVNELDGELLREEVSRIESAIRAHRDVGRPLTVDDDRALYAVLPERIPADFRLPPKDAFLGEARAPRAGCPSFWRSHANCPTTCHHLHAWGPCPAE